MKTVQPSHINTYIVNYYNMVIIKIRDEINK